MRLSFTKNWNIIFPIFFLINGKFPVKVFNWKSGSQLNLITYPEHNTLLSSRLAILLSLTTPNKQSFNAKPEIVRPVIQIIYNEKFYCTSVSKKYQIFKQFSESCVTIFYLFGYKTIVWGISSCNTFFWQTFIFPYKTFNKEISKYFERFKKRLKYEIIL